MGKGARGTLMRGEKARARGEERSRGLLGGDGERRVYEERGQGEEERGAVLLAPRSRGTSPAAAGRTEQRRLRLQKRCRAGSSWHCPGKLRGCQVP